MPENSLQIHVPPGKDGDTDEENDRPVNEFWAQWGTPKDLSTNVIYSSRAAQFSITAAQLVRLAQATVLLKDVTRACIHGYTVAREVQRANTLVAFIVKTYGKLNFPQFRGLIYELKLASSFNINAAFAGNSARAQVLSATKGCRTTYIADVIFLKDGFFLNPIEIAKNIHRLARAQLKSGITSCRRMLPKYEMKNMLYVTETALLKKLRRFRNGLPYTKQHFRCLIFNRIRGCKATTAGLTAMAKSALAGQRLYGYRVCLRATLRRLSTMGKANLVAWFLLPLIFRAVDYKNGTLTLRECAIEYVKDITFINDAKFLMECAAILHQSYTAGTLFSNTSTYLKPVVSLLSRPTTPTASLRMLLFSSSTAPMAALFCSIHSIYLAEQQRRAALQALRKQHQISKNIDISTHIAVFVSCVVSDVTRGQPLRWKNAMKSTAKPIVTRALIHYGERSLDGKLPSVKASYKTTGLTVCGLLVADFSFACYFHGWKGANETTIPSAVSVCAVVASQFSKHNTGLVVIDFAAGFALGLYAQYKTKDLPDYHMFKHTLLSTVGNALASATAGSLSIIACTALVNWWNPVGWYLTGACVGSVVVAACITSGVSNTCGDFLSMLFGQKGRHLRHCCEKLGCNVDVTRKEFASVVRRNRAKFHPDKAGSDKSADETYSEIDECIRVYCVLRRWDPENILTDPSNSEDSLAARLAAKLNSTIYSLLFSRSCRRLSNSIKDQRLFVHEVVLHGVDVSIAPFMQHVPGDDHETVPACVKQRLRVSYCAVSHYATTSFKVRRSNDEVSSVQCFHDVSYEPLRAIFISSTRPPRTIEDGGCVQQISPNHFLVGLYDSMDNAMESNESGDGDVGFDDID